MEYADFLRPTRTSDGENADAARLFSANFGGSGADLKERTWAPVVVDPSHSVGRASYVPAAALAAIAYGADGLCLECHVAPSQGIGDDPKQAITPEVLKTLIGKARQLWTLVRS